MKDIVIQQEQEIAGSRSVNRTWQKRFKILPSGCVHPYTGRSRLQGISVRCSEWQQQLPLIYHTRRDAQPDYSEDVKPARYGVPSTPKPSVSLLK
jgi:hypothetical protein